MSSSKENKGFGEEEKRKGEQGLGGNCHRERNRRPGSQIGIRPKIIERLSIQGKGGILTL